MCDVAISKVIYTKCKRPLTWQITVSDSDIGKSNGSDKGSRGRTKIDFKHFVSSNQVVVILKLLLETLLRAV